MKQLIFHPDVLEEVKRSYQWYQSKAEGLGDDFVSELEGSYQAILEFPEVWPLFQSGFKRYLLSKFPYSIIYRQKDSEIYIVAIMHNRRKPGYWLNRTK